MSDRKLQSYDVIYTDEQGNKRCWVTFGYDPYQVKCSAQECLQPGYTITSVKPIPDFDF